ncbi:MAG: hypothetical protein KKE16_01140 [Firmicutes bacterium]|nr:hypothetical protein [Bacillota bacterium]
MLTNDILTQLNRNQLKLISWIYNECINNYHVTQSNKDISTKTDIPESTVEKYLKFFDDLDLIVRSSERTQDFYTREWRTSSRKISLNPKKFNPEIIAAERSTRIDSLLSFLDSPEFLLKQLDQKLRGT